MTTDKLFIYGVHPDSFHPYEPAEIIGVTMVTAKERRPCYIAQYGNGFIDYIPFSELTNNTYKVGTLTELVRVLRDLDSSKNNS